MNLDDLDALDRRLARNLDAVMGEISAPPRSRFERTLLGALGALQWRWHAQWGLLGLLFERSARTESAAVAPPRRPWRYP